ncbi:MAG: NosD domain-containing protein [Candidatus Bathyarchaeia archaeon]|jgi:parallel beta-helix repeat protein
MNKAVLVLVAVLCLLSLSSTTTALTQVVKADSGTVYIRPDGSIDPGTTPIHTTDDNTYTLTGNITGEADGIVVERDNIVLNGAGYTVTGKGSGTGIDLVNMNNVTIKNTNIENFDYGVYLENSSNRATNGNDVVNNVGSVVLDYSVNNAVYGNNITANYGYGIRLDYSANTTVSGNNITANGGHGVYLYNSANNCVSGNNMTNNVGGFGLDYSVNNTVSENNITANNGDGVTLGSSSNNTITGNDIEENNAYGIHIDSSSNNCINGNNITANNWDGIHFDSSLNSTISGNNITANNAYGTYLDNSSGNSVSGNDITANNWNGVRLDSSANNSINENNIAANNVYGVGLYVSLNNSISGNYIANNGYGVGFDSSSNNNSIFENTITANYGHGIGLFSSSNNTIFHNNFINNDVQVYSTSDSANIWDDRYLHGGNYWSDYNGTDLKTGRYQNETGSDGIGDTPYIIDSSNWDNFPLMGMFSDFNANSQYHVQVISNSTISDFQFNGTAISFNATGENGTTGFCRISLPTAIMNETFTIFVNAAEIPYTLLQESNSTQSYLYFTYHNSTQVTIPEFPSFQILSLFGLATLSAIFIKKKRPTRTSKTPSFRMSPPRAKRARFCIQCLRATPSFPQL